MFISDFISTLTGPVTYYRGLAAKRRIPETEQIARRLANECEHGEKKKKHNRRGAAKKNRVENRKEEGEGGGKRRAERRRGGAGAAMRAQQRERSE